MITPHIFSLMHTQLQKFTITLQMHFSLPSFVEKADINLFKEALRPTNYTKDVILLYIIYLISTDMLSILLWQTDAKYFSKRTSSCFQHPPFRHFVTEKADTNLFPGGLKAENWTEDVIL